MANREPSTKGQQIESTEVEALFREHNQALLRLLTVRLGSSHVAKEVAQEAYVKLLNLGDNSTVSYQRAYLFKIAQNLVTDRLRHRAQVTKYHELHFFEEEDPTVDPERATAARQELLFLQQALRQLPPKCRLAFTLHRYRGLALSEVAAEMNLSERMVRIYVGRALAYCQSLLDERGELTDG